MKRIYLFLTALFVCLWASAQSTAPEFSTEADPVWYAVKFKTGEHYLSGPNGAKMVTTSTAASDNQKFQFIGNIEGFKMKNKAGQWVTFSDSRFAMTATAGSAVELDLVAGAQDGYFEIGRKGENNRMNQWGGTAVGVQLGEWSKGDANNQLFFEPLSVVWPQFAESADAEGRYYMIKFLKVGNCVGLSTNGEDNCVRVYPAARVDGQCWKLVGTKDNFQFVNKNGSYAIVSNENINTEEGGPNPTPIRSSATPDPNGFKLVESTNTTNGKGFEIIANNKSGHQYFNMWGRASGSNTIGFWEAGDPNNVVAFINPESIPLVEYTNTGIEGYVPEHDLTLWYNEPATTAKLYSGGQGYSNWMEYSLPIGDGQFGASLFGGVYKDEIQFNEKTLWSGRSTDLTGGGSGYGNYQNFGSVYAENLGEEFSFDPNGGATDYYRQLDLTNATGKVSFKKGDVTYTREYISSNPARVVAARYTASEAGKISLLFTLKSGTMKAATSYAEGEGTFSGKLETVSYNARFKVIPTGGTMTTTDAGIEVKGADEVVVLLAGGTDFDAYSTNYVSNTAQLGQDIQARINDAAKQSWDELYKAHVADYQSFFNRVNFQLADTKNEMPTDKLIDAYNGGKGADALMLEKLYFAYGRYLEISSSRGVDLPSNLQGIWNNMDKPAWNADIHSNINVQMNYWPAEPTNLSEMHLPFLNYIWNMAENHSEWKKYASEIAGQKRGWTCFTENNIFGGGTKFASTYVVANAWYCSHLWQHYRYTLDKEYLKKVFPAMLSASQFWMDRVKLAKDGTYECPNEWSPEHGPTEDGVAHAQQLVYELFDNTLEAIKVLGDEANVSEADLTMLQDRFAKMDKGLHTETYSGQWGSTWNNLSSGNEILKEWKYSAFTVTGDKNHRHMSHLMCLYPFSQVTPESEFFVPAVNSMKLRGDGATGWSMGWKINLWARALDGDHARTILNNALRHANGGSGVFYNLFDSHAPFQIDGNFGACAGIAEMLMQSNAGVIRLLPALPTAWTEGHITGLKTVNDYTVDITWKDGAIKQAKLVSNQGVAMPVYHKDLQKDGKSVMITANGKEINPTFDENGMAMLEGEAGTEFVIDFTQLSTGIDQAKTADNTIYLNVEGRKVSVSGNVEKVTVFDLQGRKVMSTDAASFKVKRAAGNVVMVETTDAAGHTKTTKVVLGE